MSEKFVQIVSWIHIRFDEKGECDYCQNFKNIILPEWCR